MTTENVFKKSDLNCKATNLEVRPPPSELAKKAK
jgi:hypothetical protein